MKFLHLILRSLLRSKRRTLLTIFSLAGSIGLVTTLQGLLDTIADFAHNPNAAVRIAVRSRVSTQSLLPLRYEAWIRQQPEVVAVIALQWFNGSYQGQRNLFANYAVEPEALTRVYKEEIPGYSEAEFRDFVRDRTGCVVGQALADKYHWRVGTAVPLQGTLFPVNPRLTIRGIYHSRRAADEMALYFHHRLLEESYPPIKGKVGSFWVRVRHPDQAARLIERIDRHFRDAAEPTLSETENAFQMDFLKMLGDFDTALQAITAAVLAAIVIVTASTLGMAIRERTREIAVFRAMGFTGGQVLGLVMAEGVLLAVLGGLLGTTLAWLGAGAIRASAVVSLRWLQDYRLREGTLLFCLRATLGVGLLATFIPACRAIRHPIVDGLRAP